MQDLNQKNDRVMTTKEVSEYLKIPISSLWRLTHTGKIRGVKVGKHWRYFESDIKAFLRGIQVYPSHDMKVLDQRSFARIKCAIPAMMTILLPERKKVVIQGMIRDLSEGGIFFVPASDLGVAEPIQIRFSISQSEASGIEAEGRVVHQTQDSTKSGVGIKFRNLSQKDQGAIREYVG